MHSQLYSQNIGAENISQHMLYSLIYLILNQLDKPKKRDEVSDYFIGNRKKKYLDDHYLEDLTLENISQKLYIKLFSFI